MLTVIGLVDDQINDRGYLTESIEWVLLAAVAAAAASVLRDLLAQRRDRPQPYAEATRLLTQLRTVARQLPGATLDPGGLAEHLLDDVRTVARSDRAAVMCASGGNRLVVLAQSGRDPDRLGDVARRRLDDLRSLGEPAAADREHDLRPVRIPAATFRSSWSRWRLESVPSDC